MSKKIKNDELTTANSAEVILRNFREAGQNVLQNAYTSSMLTAHSVHNQDGKTLYTSPGFSQNIDYIEVDLTAENLLEGLHLQDRVAFAHAIQCCCKDNETKSVELRVISAGNKASSSQNVHWLNASIKKIETDDNAAPLAVVTYENVTLTKSIEDELANFKEDTEQDSDTKTRFLGNMSHELRTPLNAILGFSELLYSPIGESIAIEKKHEYAGIIHGSATHLLSVLNDILDVTKIESGMYEIYSETFCLQKCLAFTVSMMNGQAQMRSINIESIGFDKMPEIVADERAVKQILINLLSNAIKFSNENSTVKVTAKRTARNVELSIIDKGIGISPDHLPKLGEAFFQADSKYDRDYEGTGLGLSVVRGLLELHDGKVSFSSQRGQGTCVTVTLPIHGKGGRSVPAQDRIEKIVDIQDKAQVEETDFSIVRKLA